MQVLTHLESEGSGRAENQRGPAVESAPRRTCVTDIADVLRAGVASHMAGRSCAPAADSARDAALRRYRQVLTAQIHHDLGYTEGRLAEFAADLSAAQHRDVGELPIVADGFRRIATLAGYLRTTDAYSGSATEEQCWVALQQFYCDALELAERLCDVEEGRRRRFGPWPRSDGTFRRRTLLGIESYGSLQTLVHAAEVAIPNVFSMRPWRTLVPTLAHMVWHQAIPWGELRWCDFERTTLGWLGDDGLACLRGSRGAGVRFCGREVLEGNAELFDPDTGKARHNVIVAASHRTGFLDFPLFAEILGNTPHAVWANNSFYTPGMARKMARNRTTIPIRGFGKMPMKDALDLSVRVLAEDGLPLFLIADGSQPNMMYGHQVRVKRGIRVLVDECVRQTRAAGRRTFVAPLTFDDPLAYLLGWDEEVVVTLHPPLEIVAPSTSERYQSRFDETAVNGGDALLNHLEALYLVNSMQPRHGLRTPDVLGAVRRKRRSDRRWGPRALLRSCFNTTVFDLSRAGGHGPGGAAAPGGG